MRSASGLIVALVVFANLSAQEPPKQEYAEFSKLIHQIVVKQLPKEFEESSGWGQTIPVPPNLKLPNLRTYIKVGDKVELPHGAWRRFKGHIEDPDKNLKIVVKDFKKRDDKTYRLVLDVDATIAGKAEWQQWQKGLMLIGIDAVADADFAATITCDVGTALDLKKFPPEVILEPKVTELNLNLVDFRIRGGPILKGEKGEALRDHVKDILRAVVKASEPIVKDEANRAIAAGLKEGKGKISTAELLKVLPAPK